MLPGSNSTTESRPGRDRSGEMRYLEIPSFETSHFPTVLVGESRYETVTLPEKVVRDRVLPARKITVERCQAVSLRTTLDGEPYLHLSDENVDLRFMPLRDKTVVGLDATEDGERITAAELTQIVAANFTAFIAEQANKTAAPADGSDLDGLPL